MRWILVDLWRGERKDLDFLFCRLRLEFLILHLFDRMQWIFFLWSRRRRWCISANIITSRIVVVCTCIDLIDRILLDIWYHSKKMFRDDGIQTYQKIMFRQQKSTLLFNWLIQKRLFYIKIKFYLFLNYSYI